MSDIDLGPSFQLTHAERHSTLWLKLQGHFETELKNLRGRNDGPLTPDQTATIRGQIAFLKAAISLGDEPPNLDG